MFTRLLTNISLAIVVSGIVSVLTIDATVSAAVTSIVPPCSQGQWDDPSNALTLDGTYPDTSTILSTANAVNSKQTAPDDIPPNQPVANTAVTAVDGEIINNNNTETRRSSLKRSKRFAKRSSSDYVLVFSGTGTGPNDRDAAIEGSAYLTYTLISNSTYDVDQCFAKCAQVEMCVFVNVFYEFNNGLLDFVFSEQSNLKCVLYGDVHSADEKTNFGGQQSEPVPAGLTYIQQSSGFAATSLVEPSIPDGYQYVFGPTDGANNAPGYMGFVFLDRYDVEACAQQCNTRDADPNGGACQYFNIWRALVDGVPTTYTCSMYFIPTDASTAVNTGQGNLQVTYSRGYVRTNYVVDGGFEGYTCASDFCFTQSYDNWIGTSSQGGLFDATIFYFKPYAHFGHGSGLLGSGTGFDSLPGTLTPTEPLQTIAGRQYVIRVFIANAFSGRDDEAGAYVDILWNGAVVLSIRPGYTNWKFFSVSVDGVGNDVLAFYGGQAPAWSFLDDIAVYQI